MSIKVIVELQAKPGRRAELQGWIERTVAQQGANPRGFLGSTRYEVLDDPDRLLEIAELCPIAKLLRSGVAMESRLAE